MGNIDFKLEQLKEKMNNGGLAIALTSLGAIAVFIIVIAIGIIILTVLSDIGPANIIGALGSSGHTSITIEIVVVCIFALAGCLLINAGNISSYKNLITTGSAGNFIDNAIKSLPKVTAYCLAVGVINIVIVVTARHIFYSPITELLNHLINAIPIFTCPLMYLCLFNGAPFNNYIMFVQSNVKLLCIIALLYIGISYIPLGDFIIDPANIILPLYIMIIYTDVTDKTIEVHEEEQGEN